MGTLTQLTPNFNQWMEEFNLLGGMGIGEKKALDAYIETSVQFFNVQTRNITKVLYNVGNGSMGIYRLHANIGIVKCWTACK